MQTELLPAMGGFLHGVPDDRGNLIGVADLSVHEQFVVETQHDP